MTVAAVDDNLGMRAAPPAYDINRTSGENVTMTQTTTHAHTDGTHAADNRMRTATPPHDEDPTTGTGGRVLARAGLSLLTGLGLLVLVFANLDRITGWADTHGPVGVYLGFFLVMSLAGRLFWWGADTLVKAAVSGPATAPQR
ncbi:hypothetical protein [Prescottella subtropica]|uniref:hypothetical protein n=1 Tax=Prescottella subtropica TaxID=2545757 RepID=UPI0010F6A298|nr:hypothetical protein [Prescottella subtropica]